MSWEYGVCTWHTNDECIVINVYVVEVLSMRKNHQGSVHKISQDGSHPFQCTAMFSMPGISVRLNIEHASQNSAVAIIWNETPWKNA